MLYTLLKFPAKLAFAIYCRDLKLNKKDVLKSNGPLLIAANHPNSFFDAVIIATLFEKPVYSLARGDVFVNHFYSSLLRSLNILPIYRMSEGAENLEWNYKTFDQCLEIFRKNGIVLIFSEGICYNEWNLRPLKKGTARLAIRTWEEGIPLKVLPTGINYNTFHSISKNIQLYFGEIISQEGTDADNSHGKSISSFNTRLRKQLEQLVIQINKEDKKTLRQKFLVRISLLRKTVLLLPAMLGWISHALFYYPLKMFMVKAFPNNDHFDSILMGLTFLLYPFYLMLIAASVYLVAGGWWWLLVFPLLPFFAWSFVQLKKQF